MNIFKSIKNLNRSIKSINDYLKQINSSLLSMESAIINEQLSKKNENELNDSEFKAFSQNGEDGIIAEIFKRLDIEVGFFVEFGVQDGLETNSTLLLYKGWQGIWIEADLNYFNEININFKDILSQNKLKVIKEFIRRDNLEPILRKNKVKTDLDLLSIDIDSNDYWVWESLMEYRPKVIIIEYNAFFPIEVEWIMEYEENRLWDSSIVFGASLMSLVKLGKDKGYTLVACNNSGSNAFFVRNDLLNGKFNLHPIEKIYKPVNYNLTRKSPVIKKIGKNL